MGTDRLNDDVRLEVLCVEGHHDGRAEMPLRPIKGLAGEAVLEDAARVVAGLRVDAHVEDAGVHVVQNAPAARGHDHRAEARVRKRASVLPTEEQGEIQKRARFGGLRACLPSPC